MQAIKESRVVCGKKLKYDNHICGYLDPYWTLSWDSEIYSVPMRSSRSVFRTFTLVVEFYVSEYSRSHARAGYWRQTISNIPSYERVLELIKGARQSMNVYGFKIVSLKSVFEEKIFHPRPAAYYELCDRMGDDYADNAFGYGDPYGLKDDIDDDY